MIDVVDRIKSNVKTVGKKYFVDPSVETIGDKKLENYKLTLLGLTYALGHNALLTGEPGFGKTTSCKIILSTFGGLPFDLYESVQMQGHPEQTKEELAHRPDYYSLLHEGERVVWQPSLYMDGYLVDEISRLPFGKQSFLLNSIETGRWSYLTGTLYFGKRPFFATSNYEDGGNHRILPPLLDRFAIDLEFGRVPGGRRVVRKATKNQKDLRNEQLTNEILDYLNNHKARNNKHASEREKERRDFIIQKAEDFSSDALSKLGIRRLDDGALKEFRALVDKVPFTPEAEVYTDFLEAELNTTQLYGMKRRSDEVDESSHAKGLASSRFKGAGMSPRALEETEDYSRAMALLLGDKKVTRAHINAVVPYILAHRLDFTQDFKADYTVKPRIRRADGIGENQQTDLTRHLLRAMEKNWRGDYDPDELEDMKKKAKSKKEEAVDRMGIYQQIGLIERYAQEEIDGNKVPKNQRLSKKQREEVETLIEMFRQAPHNIDHPFVREYMPRALEEIKAAKKKQRG